MTSPRTAKLRFIFIVAVLLVAIIVFASKAGIFLVIDHPLPSDVILVLAGETDLRPHRALDLLNKHYANRIILDVPTNATIFEFTEIQLAQQYIQDLPHPELISICPIVGLSTKEESKDVAKCLQRESAGTTSVLIVTSDFHTRRALATFRHELPAYRFSVAAAHSQEGFGAKWWTHRQWAKTFFDEWMRLLWWNAIDRWR